MNNAASAPDDFEERRARARARAELERARRQAEIDLVWERQLLKKELAREEAEKRAFHKGPGDPDWE